MGDTRDSPPPSAGSHRRQAKCLAPSWVCVGQVGGVTSSALPQVEGRSGQGGRVSPEATVAVASGISRTRVLSICRILWNGGVQRVAIGQTIGLRGLGWGCDLVFLRRTRDAAYELPPGTQVLHATEITGPRPFQAFYESLTSQYAGHRGPEATVDLDVMLDSLDLSGKYDVTIYNDQYTAVMGILNRMRHGWPYVMMFHEFYPKVHPTLARRLFLYPLADLFDVFSLLVAPAVVTTGKKNYDRLLNIVPDKVYLARLGAPEPQRVEISGRDRFSVCSVSIWDSGRHPETYLEVARLAPEFQFVIAGLWPDDQFRQELVERARGLPNVRITGEVSEAERERLLARSLIYLRLGYNEGGPGMGGLEAMARGSLVIANRGLGISEIIHDGTDGFVCDEASAESVVRVLKRIGDLPVSRLAAISDAALALAGQHSWQAHVQVLGQALDTALGRAGAAPRRPSTSQTVTN